MIRHHPDKNMLLEYTVGSLPEGPNLIVAAHVQMCTECRAQYHTMNTLGGSILENCTEQSLKENAFEQLMGRIDQSPAPKGNTAADRPKISEPLLNDAPPVVHKLLAKNPPIKWKSITPALKMCRLSTGQDKYEVSFHRLSCGGKVAEHDHRGAELTLVLYGRFSDSNGVYGRGDFLLREPGEVHRPTVTEDQECLCFSAVQAPVALTGVNGWLLNRLIPFHPG
ncbi:ChrR family anti-sigma-E factor [Microbulbifer sp. OS29]|uniref:ChrR family anti-sigma-E factor n=1 Tax=Microbulbifer okhotskensis TaxID=2926617 RepID=A0A9X2EQM4_9GAMM|nr:ChrR family anti-sigma-E factor [Microbulbifer okhotskensis]MCO1336039.1 ChrR family anti-sigma-E factor [Microbulbifer okhotskensis]